MKNSYCTVITFTSFTYYHFYFIASLSFWLPKRYYCFFFRILILNAIFNFQFFYWCFISNNYCLQMLYTLTYYCCFSTIDGFVVFHYVRELLFFPKTLLCLHFASVIKRCSVEWVFSQYPKVVEKIYLWVNSFLTEMQLFSMRLDFHRENKIHRYLSRIFLKPLKKNYFAKQLLMAINLDSLSSFSAFIVL